MYGFARTPTTDNNYTSIPYIDPNSVSSDVAIYTIGDNLTVYSGIDRSLWYVYITIEYTKTTD